MSDTVRVAGDVVPTPDPTILTMESLERGLLNLRLIIEARLDGNDRVRAIMLDQIDSRQETIDRAVNHLQSVHDEKFRSIATQFSERDTRTEQTSRDSKVAVDAALQAAKEAVGEQNKSNALANSKMETAFTKQIDQVGALLGTNTSNLDGKINDVKDRIALMEGTRSGARDIWGYIVGAIGVLIALAAVVISVLTHH